MPILKAPSDEELRLRGIQIGEPEEVIDAKVEVTGVEVDLTADMSGELEKDSQSEE